MLMTVMTIFARVLEMFDEIVFIAVPVCTGIPVSRKKILTMTHPLPHC